MINRKAFFDAVRAAPFGGRLTAGQVQGMNAILDEWERRRRQLPAELAYLLATPFHETARTMQPVIETRQPTEAQNPSVETAITRLDWSWHAGRMPWVKSPYWRKDKDGLSWLGRGLPQVTHKFNYERAEKETGIPFTKHPELMLVLENAVPVMFLGMLEGWFTGKKLGDYFTPALTDFRNARKIINGLESADKVAGYARQFLEAILDAR